jgi:hypothetical protein
MAAKDARDRGILNEDSGLDICAIWATSATDWANRKYLRASLPISIQAPE